MSDLGINTVFILKGTRSSIGNSTTDIDVKSAPRPAGKEDEKATNHS